MLDRLGIDQRKRKPRRRKGPNPLSVNKSFIRDRVPVVEGGVVSRSKVRIECMCVREKEREYCYYA